MTDHFLTPLLNQFVSDANAKIAELADTINLALAGAHLVTGSPTLTRKGRESIAAAATSATPAKGQKRSPAELERMVELVYNIIKAHPGERVEQLAPRIDLSTKEMQLPIRKLVAARRVQTKGQKRATTYSIKASK